MDWNNVKITDVDEFANIFNIFCSDANIKIIFMAEDRTTIREIERKTEHRKGTVYKLLDRLKDLNLIEYNNKKIFLTSLGKILKNQLITIKNIGLIGNMLNEDYWKTHLIPQQFLPYIYVFHDAELIENTNYDDSMVLNKTTDMILNGKYLYGIVSAVAKNYIKVVEKIIKEGKEVKIIASNTVKKIISEDKFLYDKVSELKKYKNAELIFGDKIDKFTLLFTDKEVMLFLFKNDGKVEWNECVHSKNVQALNFSKEIFNYHLYK